MKEQMIDGFLFKIESNSLQIENKLLKLKELRESIAELVRQNFILITKARDLNLK